MRGRMTVPRSDGCYASVSDVWEGASANLFRFRCNDDIAEGNTFGCRQCMRSKLRPDSPSERQWVLKRYSRFRLPTHGTSGRSAVAHMKSRKMAGTTVLAVSSYQLCPVDGERRLSFKSTYMRSLHAVNSSRSFLLIEGLGRASSFGKLHLPDTSCSLGSV